ncbi:uncharacterized protein LOC122244579 [Penaeus japonicus]|uniref:uncharacterized protein LOC122244579 n=1 Tax=Penaeus japonicus TaxID=27405 RepID=UPI001C70EB1B|nr:uncharacterized protein LOC122244579 [Penaeus japonicus]
MVVTTEARRTVLDSHGMKDIHKAVVEGNIDYVRRLLESKENVHRKTEDLSTPLHFSAFRGSAEIVQLLLDKGSDVNAENETGDTPLHLASLRGHIEAINILLERKADPRCSTDSGHTPLHYASLGGFKEIVKKLIEAGADVNALDVRRCTPLHYAASAGHTAVVEDLAENGADLRLSTDAGTSALHDASFYGRLDAVQRLAEMCPDLIAFRDKSELSAEDTAHVRGQVQPAWWLHKQAKREIDKESLNYRAAICKENIKVYGELSLRINSNNQAANASVLASCIDFGLFEIHYQDTQGRTLLHLAAERNDIENIKLLLERGALPTARTFLNKTPGDLAKEKGHLKAFNIIRNYLCETKESSEKLYLELLELITKTAYHDAHARTTPYDPEAKDPSIMGQSPLLSAVRKASLLVSSGAPLEPPGSHTCYPLHLAITTNCTPLLPLLLAAGAPLTATREGLGPVQLAWLTPDITTWVGTLVTKVVRDKIQTEMQSLDGDLQAPARTLLGALDGEKPWEATFECPANSSDSLDSFLFRACKGGATTLAWWIWNSGGSAVSLHREGATPLHAALDAGHLDTARALALHMGGNLFLPDAAGRLPISLMSEKNIQESMAREYNVLEQEKEKVKDSISRRRVLEVMFLFLVLCLEFDPQVNSPDYDDERWRTVLAWLLSVHGEAATAKEKEGWIGDISDKIWRISQKADTDNGATIPITEETDESDYKVLLESVSKIRESYWNHLNEMKEVLWNRSLKEKINELLKVATIKSCEKDMPLFLHLLSCVADVKMNDMVDTVCGGFPLHYAARHNNLSAAKYIVSKGASQSVQDRFGNTPAHYAYMFGHKEVGDFLRTESVNKSGLTAEAMLQRYIHYLKEYDLDLDNLQRKEMYGDNTAPQIIQKHLQNLERKWMNSGISQSVKECHVDFTSGEAQEIQKAVSEFIQQLMLSVSTENALYKGELHMVGSSGENVRLFCPDEFDFNIIMKNMGTFCPQTHDEKLECGSVRDLKLSNLENIYYTVKQCLATCEPKDNRLAIVLPGVKKTQVGVGLSLVWTGKVFPLLLVDVDVVPTMKAKWPYKQKETKLLPSAFDNVYINSIGNNEGRFSFALAENAVMKDLSEDKRRVFLACKMVLSALKVEKWAPRHIQNKFKYFHDRFFKIPSPKGFLLKNTFFLELEEVTDEERWTEGHLVERMISIFRKMCEKYTDPATQVTSWEPAAVKPYFAGRTQSPCIGFGAPEILEYVESTKGVRVLVMLILEFLEPISFIPQRR